MERIIRLHIEKLPEGVYLATSDDVRGLVAQAGTLRELLDLVPELVAMLDEIRADEGWSEPSGSPVPPSFELPFVLAAQWDGSRAFITGSHEGWINRRTGRITIVPRHAGDLPEGTLRAILRQAGITPDDFLAD